MFDNRILDIVEKFYKRFMARKVLKTTEEVEANTNETNLVAAPIISELFSKLSGCSFEQEGENFFIVGADSVRKKLGNDFSELAQNLEQYKRASGSYSVTVNIPQTDGLRGFIIHAGCKGYNLSFSGTGYVKAIKVDGSSGTDYYESDAAQLDWYYFDATAGSISATDRNATAAVIDVLKLVD